jgi:nucleotide-binding universal stress UspA family protein
MSAHHPAVVVGYDFSHSGEAALERAVHLAGRAPEHVLHILCAIDPKHGPPSIPVYDGIDYLYAARVQEALAISVREACERTGVSSRITFFVHARIGKSADELLRLAEEVGAALIVVGSHGLTGIERVLLGSTSERIVREAKCSVEVARPNKYPEVELLPVVEVPGHDHTYVPPHRYEYEDRRVMLRPTDWPLM